MVAKSSILRVISISKNDKQYFNETVKKLLDERIQEKTFIDLDRPLKKLRSLYNIRDSEKKWENYKTVLEE